MRNHKWLAVVLAAAMLLSMMPAVPAVASSSVLYVPDDHATIQAAINAASTGDTIVVRAGTYSENVIINTGVALVGEPGAVLAGSGTGTGLQIRAANVTIDGLEIRNFAIGIRTYGGRNDFGNMSILSCNIHSNTQNGILIVYDVFQRVTIADCVISQNAQNGIGISDGATISELILDGCSISNGRHGMFVAGATITDIRIVDSSFDGSTTNGFSGITFATTASDIGSFSMEGGSLSGNKGSGLSIVQIASEFGSILLEGVTISDNRESGIMLGGGASTGSLTIANSVFASNGWEDIDLSGGWWGAFSVTGDTTITCNRFLGGAWAGIYVGSAGTFSGQLDINYNCFTLQGHRVHNLSSKPVNAAHNWWGRTEGPYPYQTSGSVVVAPWLAYLHIDTTIPVDTPLSAAVIDSNGNATHTPVSILVDGEEYDGGPFSVGVYEVEASALNGCLTETVMLAVYDPSAGFVTGGGWVWSPAGALPGDPPILPAFTEEELDQSWGTDRWFPTGGVDSVSAFGRDDVVRIGIDSTETQSNTFHRTEGIKTVGGDYGSFVEVDLYLNPDWSAKAVRAGFWVVGDNGSGARDQLFGILEFVNLEPSTSGDSAQGDHTGWRIWSSSMGAWTNLATAFSYGQWVTIGIELDVDNQQYNYYLDGVLVGHAVGGEHFIRELFLNSYNYGLDEFPNLDNGNYSAHWHAGLGRGLSRLEGRATFAFVSRYQRGASTPDGNTQFQFRAADLTFRSTEYEWLVISGHRAQFKGVGTINGEAGYGFLLTAIDGDLTPSQNYDSFRIKIWCLDTGAIVYDNQMGKSDTGDWSTELGGGSIVIHTQEKDTGGPKK